MPLSVGDRLGHYEVLAPLGAGGMGEVYRARDTQLEREVAIKVLPVALANDPDRLGRFDREAKILAALNHPNIAVIHGLVESGATSQGSRALVMELVEGETLADRIRRGPLSLEEALQAARQIAEALEAAHEKGIVHRDLKPGNVMLTPAGSVKVLDFGLAAIVQSTPSAPADPFNSPTLTMNMTQAGVILGTAAYMSPEQAAGTAVDRRADIWSFGVVLWEMLSGSRLFSGDTVAHTLAAVLQTPVDFENVSAPSAIKELLRRCLDRDVKSRLQWIGEARIAITRYLVDPKRGAESTAQTASLPYKTDKKRAALALAVAIALAVAAAYVSFVHFREVAPEVRAVNTTLLPPENAEFDFSAPHALLAISPDGTRIVFGAKTKGGKQQLWQRRLDSPAAQPLPGTEDAGFPFWSPDSRWVAFGQGNKLKKIDIQGGPPVPVTDFTAQFRGGSWNAQGVIIFALNSQSPLLRVSASGGTAVPTTGRSGDSARFGHRSAWFLPDGKHFLYTISQEGDVPVRVGSLDEPSKPGKVVAQAHSTVQYAQGHLLYLRENTLMAQPFDVERLETTGEAIPVAEGIPTYTTPARPAGFSASPTGLLVYITGAAAGQSRLVWKDREGKLLGNLGEPTGPIGSISLSPDGKRLAATIGNRGSGGDLWIYDTAPGVPTRFTFDSKGNREPRWSPDGNMLYYSNNQKGPFDLYRKASSGASNEELVFADNTSKYGNGISPDGKLLLYYRVGEKTREDIWVMPSTPGGKDEARTFLQTPFREGDASFSPDGKWVAYDSNESGQIQVYAAPFPGPGGKRQISPAGGEGARWRRDGREIF